MSGVRASSFTVLATAVASITALLFVPAPSSADVLNVYPEDNAITVAVDQSAPGDTILVHPGVYPFEIGSVLSHSLTIIGVGGAGMNEIRICTDLCVGALINVRPFVGQVRVEGLTLTENHWYPGRAIGFITETTADVSIEHCVLFDLLYGVYAYNNVRVQENLFVGNGIFCGDRNGSEISGNTFVGSGITLEDDVETRFTGNIFYQSTISCRGSSHPTFACNDFWQCTFTVCSNPVGTDNNFAGDPLFCDVVANDYHLQPDSPCLPENSPPGCGLIGAFGLCEDLAVEDPAEAPSLSRLEVHPNPASRFVEFSLSVTNTTSSIEIFDAHGRQVDVLRPTESHVTWYPQPNVSRGVYFARLTGDTSRVVKFVLVR